MEEGQAVRILCGVGVYREHIQSSKLWARAAPCFRFTPFFKLHRWIFQPFFFFFLMLTVWSISSTPFSNFCKLLYLVRHETRKLLSRSISGPYNLTIKGKNTKFRNINMSWSLANNITMLVILSSIGNLKIKNKKNLLQFCSSVESRFLFGYILINSQRSSCSGYN